ncbi:Ger(x)C family spore germination protein [Bacillus sp. T33-2]|uniref:Ger(x)C family spore germination protein n=1 Tax=Bacillus sp. T33-2 TaxID=2054168 RepID=UPI000C770FC5|nr:Ger(x)C family spore germination protein [Bacillus sp. T33-2]PLR92581.1 Ger(x)C family spore germination protein [Bacillus sp. T33-2]
MKKQMFALMSLFLLLLSGCVEKEIIDDVNIEMGFGYDKGKGRMIEGTAMIPVFEPDKKIGNFSFTGKSTIAWDVLSELQRKSSQPLVRGRLEVVVFGEKLAERGIYDIVDSFQRDPSVGARVYLTVSEGRARDILSGTYGNRGNAVYLSDLIEHNTENRDLPETNLHLFLFDYYQEGKDPYLPKLKKAGKDLLEIEGVSVFKKDKVVDMVPEKKMFFFKLMVDRHSEGSVKIDIDKEQAEIRSITSSSKMKLDERNPYSVTMNIKINGVVRDYSGQKLTHRTVKAIEKTLEEKVNKECTQLARQFQEKDIDPVGFGEFIKSKTRGFDIKKWEKQDYKSLKVKINTDVVITETGVVE